jgi:hypothetical protein
MNKDQILKHNIWQIEIERLNRKERKFYKRIKDKNKKLKENKLK